MHRLRTGGGPGGRRPRHARGPGPPRGPGPVKDVVISEPCGYETDTAVTMPNMPASRSAWVRMWQCHTHTPGLEACHITE
jgi:hypothetical protein